MIAYDVRNLTKIYPKQSRPANDDVSLQIGQGEIFGLLGDNGAGKTTLVRQMVNLLPSTSGTIKLFGKDVTGDPLNVPTHVGYMPQEADALNNLSVAEALFFTARLRGMSRRDARRERDRLMARWEIGHIRDSYSSRLGVVYLGASTEEQLLRRYARALELLRFEVDGELVGEVAR